VPPPRDLEDAAACPHKGPAVVRPLDRGAAATDLGTAATTPDRGTSATARRGHGVAATGWGVHRRARSGATAVVARDVANESGWSVVGDHN
jgi:predicted small lipoprotein YifL